MSTPATPEALAAERAAEREKLHALVPPSAYLRRRALDETLRVLLKEASS